jgi:flagellar biogenesis protein FliO
MNTFFWAMALSRLLPGLDYTTSSEGFELTVPLSKQVWAQAETRMQHDRAQVFIPGTTGFAGMEGEATPRRGPVAHVHTQVLAKGLAITLEPRDGADLSAAVTLLSEPHSLLRVGMPTALATSERRTPSATAAGDGQARADRDTNLPRRSSARSRRAASRAERSETQATEAQGNEAENLAAAPPEVVAADLGDAGSRPDRSPTASPVKGQALASLAARPGPAAALKKLAGMATEAPQGDDQFGWEPAGTAAHPRTAAPAASSTLLRLWPACMALVCTAAGALWLLQQRRKKEGREGSAIHILAARSLGGRHKLAVVQVDGERLLLAMSDHEVSLISHLAPADPNEAQGREVLAQQERSSTAQRFSLPTAGLSPFDAGARAAGDRAMQGVSAPALPQFVDTEGAAAGTSLRGCEAANLSEMSSDVQGLINLRQPQPRKFEAV